MNRTATKAISILTLIITLGLGVATATPSNAGDIKPKHQKMMPAKLNIVQTAAANELLSTLVSLIKTAGLVDALSGKGPFTVFAPTNKAFDKLAKNPNDANEVEAAVAALVANPTALAEVLKYHVVVGNYPASELKNNMKLKTLTGENVIVKRYTNGKVKLFSPAGKLLAMVTTPDVKTKNGVVHVIDNVLLSQKKPDMPAPKPDEAPKPSVPNAEPNLSTLMKVLEQSGLSGALSGSGKYTVLAPDNRAFAKLSKNPDNEAMVEADMAKLVENKDLLKKVLANHVFEGVIKFDELTDGRVLYNILGDAVIVKRLNADTVQLTDETSKSMVTITTRNIDKPYGIVHVVDCVLLP